MEHMDDRWSVLTVTTVGIFMSSLDISLLIVGLPVLLSEFGVDLAFGSWVITTHRLALVILLMPIGKLSDTYGRARLYSAGYFIFAFGALLSALSTNIYQMMAFRAIQGVGAAFIFVNSIAIVTDAFAGRGLGTGIGINQVAINAGTVMGYTLSGVVISLYGWRTLFLIDFAVGLLGGIWAKMRLKEYKPPISRENGSSFDLKGTILFSAALITLLYTLTMGSSMPLPLSIFLIIQGVMMFLISLWVEKNSENPMLDLKLFRIRTFTAGNISNLLNGITFSSLAFLISIYLEIVRGFTPMQAGLTLIPLDLTLIMVGPLSGWLSDRIGAKILSTMGLAISGLALLTLSNITTMDGYTVLYGGLIMAGLGIGLFRSPNASSVMSSIPPQHRGLAAGIRSTIINVSTALGIPFAISTIYLVTSAMGGSPAVGQELEVQTGWEISKDLLTKGIEGALVVSSAINFIAAVISYLREG